MDFTSDPNDPSGDSLCDPSMRNRFFDVLERTDSPDLFHPSKPKDSSSFKLDLKP